MNKNESLLLFISTILLFISCNKEIDENGYKITYYKNKTAVGYVFYMFENDSTSPVPNIKMESYCSGGSGWILPGGNSHIDHVYSDNNGKYVCKLVKRIENDKVSFYQIRLVDGMSEFVYDIHEHLNVFYDSSINNIKVINIDTIFLKLRQ
jgi:hypothetical protein